MSNGNRNLTKSEEIKDTKSNEVGETKNEANATFDEVNESGEPIGGDVVNETNVMPIEKVKLRQIIEQAKLCYPKTTKVIKTVMAGLALFGAFMVGAAFQENKDADELEEMIENGTLVYSDDDDEDDGEDD